MTIPAATVVSVALDKLAVVDPIGDQLGAKVGDTIHYSYLVTNTGNVSLTAVAVNDPTIGPVTCPAPSPPLARSTRSSARRQRPHGDHRTSTPAS